MCSTESLKFSPRLRVIFESLLSFCPTPEITNSFMSSFKTLSESDHLAHYRPCATQGRSVPSPISAQISSALSRLPPAPAIRSLSSCSNPSQTMSPLASKPHRGHSFRRADPPLVLLWPHLLLHSTRSVPGCWLPAQARRAPCSGACGLR